MDFRDEWDGYRAIATIDAGRVNLRSRNGLSLDSKYPPIVQELKRLKLKSAILDGEIAVLDSERIPRFELLQRFHSCRRRVQSDSATPLKGTGKSSSERHENEG
jgi:ATP-dependent DNA ligase